MEQKKLRVRARGSAMVMNYEALDASPRRLIGRVYDPNMGVAGGWPATADVVEVPFKAEYARHLRDGDLWAADKESADLAGVSFDPKFGGEYDQLDAAAKPAAKKAE